MVKRNLPRWRVVCGILAIALVVVFNPWTASLLSPDGHLESGSTLLVSGLDVVLVVLGLLFLWGTPTVITGLTISFVAFLFALIAVDLAARAFLQDKLYYRPEDIYKNRLPELPSHSLFDRNVSYTGKAWGDLASMTTRDELREERTVTFRTDSFGYRNDHVDTTKPLDLIILGDSFGSGAGTSQADMWDAHFRQKYGLNVYNLSMPGYSPWHELVTLKRELGRLNVGPQTTVLWAIFGGNDFDELGLPNLNPPEAGWGRRVATRLRTFFRRSPIKLLADRVLFHASAGVPTDGDSAMVTTLPDGRTFLFYSQYVRHERRSADDIRQLPTIPRLQAEFADIKKFSEEKGIRVLVAHLPTSYSIYDWVLDNRPPWSDSLVNSSSSAVVLRELCDQNGLMYVDLYPRMLHEARQLYNKSGEMLWWRDDTHWNEHGHEVAATIIGDWLKANVPARAKNDNTYAPQ